ncbi:kelch-like protein 17 [Gigaspora margarita]|uniref:Kelch-like protein 17 n=1 Tax=Gigaspora margarita TaxID=4874 RepID=A0A8H4AD06_GIGMA|nr:kelch-like protein 17 [Gigaspora margarita]
MDLLRKIKAIYNKNELADTKIIVGDGEQFYAHSLILMLQSEYFNKTLKKSWAKKVENFYIITKPNTTKVSMDNVLQYLYSQKPYNSQGAKEFIDTFSLADEMCIQEYLTLLRQYFGTNIEILLSKDLLLILDFIDIYNNMKDTVVKTIFNNPKLIYSSDKFQNLPIQYLKMLISDNNLNINEIQIFKKVILWSNHNKNWEMLNYVCFDQITDKDFDELRNVIKAEQLHSYCNNKGATIVIGKSKNEDDFIGGYNPLNWSTEAYKGTEDSFIFRSKDKNMRLGRVKSYSYFCAISCHPEGIHFGHYDLYIPYDTNYCTVGNQYYESTGRSESKYFIDYFEVFQVIKYK